MAKQTFTTGQVLTAAQMTSLQQTAMGGGSTTAKTVSYVLVAADAGTVVQMNSASATTITVNTALFAAGDTVEIQNVGAGVCTVTAGTATVNTSSTLALKQYDAGSLYFNSASAAIFFATDAADSTSPLTTKGDLYTFSTLDARLPVGTNNQILVADSAEATGLKWATAGGGLSAATQAEMETASSTSVAVTPGLQQYHPSSSKAWIVFNGEGTIAIIGSYNITSITDNGTGVYRVDWNVDFSNTNYAVAITSAKTTDAGIQSSTVMVGGTYGIFAGYVEMYTANVDGTAKDSPRINVVAYGDQ